MKFKRIKAVLLKETLHIIRDPLSLTLSFLLPLILITIFSQAITFDIKEIKAVYYDLDKSDLSREYISAFKSSGYFKIIEIGRYKEIEKYFAFGKAKVSIVIPQDFSKRIMKGENFAVQIIIDGSDPNYANISLSYIYIISETFFSKKLKFKKLIEPEIRFWYNPELKSKNFIITGLIAVLMVIICALLTSLTISREWERGTMEKIISTPLKGVELILGKMAPYFIIGFIDLILSVFLSIYIFKVPFKGSFLLLGISSSIFLFGGLSIGILISIITKSQLLSTQLSMILTFLPAFLLSGFMFSIENMPKFIQFITYFIPARYFVKILRYIFLKGSPFNFLIFELGLLLIFGFLIFLLANKKFKKELE